MEVIELTNISKKYRDKYEEKSELKKVHYPIRFFKRFHSASSILQPFVAITGF